MTQIGSALSLLVLLTLNHALAAPKFKYYGESFYKLSLDQAKPQVAPEQAKVIIRRILEADHKKTDGYDRIIKDCGNDQNCYRQKKLNYSKEVRPAVMAIIQAEESNATQRNTRVVITGYCKKSYKVRYINGRYQFPNHKDFNVEHTFPKSRFKHESKYDMMVSDLHNLYPVHSETNALRGHYLFNDLPGDQNYISFCKTSEFGQINGNYFFEPPLSHKGNVARAMLYFALRYKMKLMKKELDILLAWNERDPVDKKEQIRVERIFKIQFNRNPFIDYPHLGKFLRDTLLTDK